MDDGEVIPGLNEPWTFAGATATEWGSGMVMLMITSELFHLNPARSMPILIAVIVGTALLMAQARRSFPDEQRGLRNFLMVSMGLRPPGMPAPAQLQPIWSGCPLRTMSPMREFVELDLDKVLQIKAVEE